MAKETQEEEKMLIFIDPKRTNGGLRTNGKNYVGKITVPVHFAEDLLRRQEEYAATISKLTDPSVKLRNQNIDISRKMFMADPQSYGNHPKFSRITGMLDAFQLEFVSPKDLEEWKEERMGLYNY